MQEEVILGTRSRTSLAISHNIMEVEEEEISITGSTAPSLVTIPVLKKKCKRRATSAFAKPCDPVMRPGRIPRRPYSAYTNRAGEAENMPKYDEASSNREWWRCYVKDTPIPGSYHIAGFLDEMQKSRCSYRFRDTSRVKSACHQRFTGTGEMLIPGRYDVEGFVQDSAKKTMTYGFKATERHQGPKIGHGCNDKELTTNPAQYNVIDWRKDAGNEKGMKTYHFKSHVARDLHLAHQFKVAVPGPGTYSYIDSAFGLPKPVPIPASAMQHKKRVSYIL